MGATLQQDLAINFLAALKNIWSEHSGTHEVHEEAENLIPALAQITIRWLAALAREQLEKERRDLQVRGNIIDADVDVQPADAFRNRRHVSLRRALNSIVHGEPQWVSVQDGDVILCWKYEPRWDSNRQDDTAYSAYFQADSLLAEVRRALYSHDERLGQVLELEQLIRTNIAYRVLIPGTGE